MSSSSAKVYRLRRNFRGGHLQVVSVPMVGVRIVGDSDLVADAPALPEGGFGERATLAPLRPRTVTASNA
jgi:hypothetical protein